VVLLRAYVRATGSGAGCVNKWPICNGEGLGTNARAQTIIEFTHRMTSGIALLVVACLAVLCWRVTSKRDWARYSAVLAAAFLANEALLGGALVLLDYVGKDKSVGRILFLSLHFGNTLLLLAALSLTAAWLSNGGGGFALARSRRQVITIGASLFATMVIGITGALSALGDTLFPATSLRAAVLQDFSRGTPALLRFRLLHRPVAVITACYVLRIIFKSSNPAKPYFATSYCAHHRYTCAARHWHDECSTSRPRFSPNPASIRSDVIRILLVLASPTWCSSVQAPSLALWWQQTIRLSEPELRTPGMWL
jgi:heme A synthase